MSDPVTTVTNLDLLKMVNALKALGNRKMANVGADLKVLRMLRVLLPLTEPLDEVKQREVQKVLDGVSEGASGLVLSKMNVQIAEVQQAVDKETVDVALPVTWALKETDLPKEQSGADGWKNAAGLGSLLADLGPLYTDV